MEDDKRYQKLVFCRDNYQWNRTEEEARVEMWKDITTFLQILFKQGMIAVVYDDDTDIIVVQYGYEDKNWGDPYPYWLTEDEYWKATYNENEVEEDIGYLCGKQDNEEINF